MVNIKVEWSGPHEWEGLQYWTTVSRAYPFDIIKGEGYFNLKSDVFSDNLFDDVYDTLEEAKMAVYIAVEDFITEFVYE